MEPLLPLRDSQHTCNIRSLPPRPENRPPATAYQIYMNSGTGHSDYTLNAKDPKEQKFVPYQMLTYLIIYQHGSVATGVSKPGQELLSERIGGIVKNALNFQYPTR